MHTRYAVLGFLETIPNNLEGLYSDIFKSFDTLDTTSHALVEFTLILLVLSALPNVHGLENNDLLDVDMIVDNCRGLVVIYPDSGIIGSSILALTNGCSKQL